MPRTDGDRWMTSPDVRRLTPTGIDLSRSSRASRTSDGCHAHAGINRRQFRPSAVRAAPPRTRGDRPSSISPLSCASRPTPHARGSTPPPPHHHRPPRRYPARAGIDLGSQADHHGRGTLPRTRGDRPLLTWTSRSRRSRYPARAGITRSGSKPNTLPRSCGDRPVRTAVDPNPAPPTRGSCLVVLSRVAGERSSLVGSLGRRRAGLGLKATGVIAAAAG